jgi:hypothetical protein
MEAMIDVVDQAEAGSSKIPVGQVIAMLAEGGDDLASIQVPANLGPEESSGAKPEPRSGPEAQAKEEKPAPKKERKEEEKAESSSGSGEGEATEQETAGGRHKEIRHPKPLFPSVSRLFGLPLSRIEMPLMKSTDCSSHRSRRSKSRSSRGRAEMGCSPRVTSSLRWVRSRMRMGRRRRSIWTSWGRADIERAR